MATVESRELFDLTRKVAVITGGAGDIGKVTAEGLSDAGASVVVAALTAWPRTSPPSSPLGGAT